MLRLVQPATPPQIGGLLGDAMNEAALQSIFGLPSFCVSCLIETRTAICKRLLGLRRQFVEIAVL
jgi:hypothetical protein